MAKMVSTLSCGSCLQGGWREGGKREKYATPWEEPGAGPPAGPGVPLWLSDVRLAAVTLPRGAGPDLSAPGGLMRRMSVQPNELRTLFGEVSGLLKVHQHGVGGKTLSRSYKSTNCPFLKKNPSLALAHTHAKPFFSPSTNAVILKRPLR